MSRPRTRTATLAPERLKLLREVFGSSLHAFRTLKSVPWMYPSYSVFRRVWDGKEEAPEVVEGVEGAWGLWTQALIERVKAA